MTLQAVRQALDGRPFAPFRVRMTSGAALEVRSPEQAFLIKRALVVGVSVADDGVPDDFRVCTLDEVAWLEPLVDTASPA